VSVGGKDDFAESCTPQQRAYQLHSIQAHALRGTPRQKSNSDAALTAFKCNLQFGRLAPGGRRSLFRVNVAITALFDLGFCDVKLRSLNQLFNNI